MAVVNEVETRYRARGAKEAQRADQGVRDSLKDTAKTARQESGEIDRWMERHKTAIQAIGVATLAAVGAITSASPALRAETSAMRMEFSLMAMELGDHLQPAFESAADGARWLRKGFEDLPEPVQAGIAYLTLAGTIIASLAGIAATAQTVISGTLVAKAFGALVAGAKIVVGAIATIIGAITLKIAIIAIVIAAIVGFVAAYILNWRGARDKTNEFIGDIVDRVTSGFSAFVSFAVQKAGEFRDGVVNRATELRDDAVSRATDLRDDIVARATDLRDDAVDRATDLRDDIVSRVTDLRDDAIDRATDLRDDVTDRITDLRDNAEDWGKDMLDNFIDGIRDRIGRLKNVVGDVEDEISDRISFDIAANDRMARRWGQDLVEEFSTGVERARPELEQSLETPRPQPTSPPSTGEGGSTTVIFERGAIQVESGGSPRQTADRTADEVSETIQDEFGSRR